MSCSVAGRVHKRWCRLFGRYGVEQGTCRPAILYGAMALALHTAFPALPLEGGFLAMIETTISSLSRERLSAQEREFVSRLRSLAESFGAYVLDAESREDLLMRADAVLEDPSFHREQQDVAKAALTRLDKILAAEAGSAEQSNSYLVLGGTFGPASMPHLRELHRLSLVLGQHLSVWHKKLVEDGHSELLNEIGDDPLWFLSEPAISVPEARGMLAGARCSILSAAACAAVLRGSVEGHIGEVFVEVWVKETREFLAFFASALEPLGVHTPPELVPLDMRFDPKTLEARARATLNAYARFEDEAERSGEPVYPSP